MARRRNTQFTRLGRRNETFDVEGVDDLAAALAEMGEVERHAAMRKGFAEAADFVLHDMQNRVPRRTGELANHLIRVVHVRAGKVTSADIGPRATKRSRWWSDRARWLEFGTKAHGKGGGNTGAQPFMRPSIDNNVEAIASILVDGVRRAARLAGFAVTR